MEGNAMKYVITKKQNPLFTTAMRLLYLIVGALSVFTLFIKNVPVKTEPISVVQQVMLQEVTKDDLPNVINKFVTPDAVKCMALNIYHEARSEPLVSKLAIADVVLNRTKDVRSPDTICAVVYESLQDTPGYIYNAKCQFSWYCDGKSDEPKENAAWQEALNLAKNILVDSYGRGISEGATHYHRYDIRPPAWTKNKEVVLVGRIGAHIFYRWQ